MDATEEPFVTVEILHDPLEADVLADLLRENGITTRVLGTRSAALIGVGQNILALRIEVPESEVDTARAVAAAFLERRGEELLRAEGVVDDDEEQPETTDTPPPPPTRSLAAAWVAFLFGGSHWYVGHRLTGAVLAAAMAAALLATAEFGVVGLAAVLTLLALDALGGQVAFGRPPNRPLQLSIGVGMVASTLVVTHYALGTWGEPGASIGRRIDLGWVILTTPAIAFGLWLWPKWRRQRRERKAAAPRMTLGNRFAREAWLGLNSITGIGLALFFLGLVTSQALGASSEAYARYRFEQLAVSCADERITIRNQSGAAGVVAVTSAAILHGGARSRYRIGPDGERVHVPPARHDLELAPTRVELAAGQQMVVPFARAATGPCLQPDDPRCRDVEIHLAGDLGADRYTCDLGLTRAPADGGLFLPGLGEEHWLPPEPW